MGKFVDQDNINIIFDLFLDRSPAKRLDLDPEQTEVFITNPNC